jgi:hypothetical protein
MELSSASVVVLPSARSRVIRSENRPQPSSSGHPNGCPGFLANVPSWPASAHSPAELRSDFGLLSHLERIVDFNAEVTHGALQFGMA